MGIYNSTPIQHPTTILTINSSFVFTSIATNKTITNDQFYCLFLEMLTLQPSNQSNRIIDIRSYFILSNEQNEILQKQPTYDALSLINLDTVSLTPFLDFVIDTKLVDLSDNFDKMLNMDMKLAGIKASMQKISFNSDDYKGILKTSIGYIM